MHATHLYCGRRIHQDHCLGVVELVHAHDELVVQDLDVLALRLQHAVGGDC